MESIITPQDQQWFLSGLYVLETIQEEQEETQQYVQFNYRKEMLPNDISLSELDEKSIASDRKTFELFKNILSNLRRNEN